MHGVCRVEQWRGAIATLASATILTGCVGEGVETETSALTPPIDQTLLIGSVGDGPVVGASLSVSTASGEVIATLTSDATASYSVAVEAPESAFPLEVTATGGTDLVTNLAPDFLMRGAAVSGGERAIANVNPFTTLAVELAFQLDGQLDATGLSTAEELVVHALDTGLTSLLTSGTLATEVDESNVAEIVRASEALAEIVRRTRDYRASTADEIVDALASDLVDGAIEGRGGSNVDPRTAAVASLVATLVRLETMTNTLRVNGADATSAMIAATTQVSPAAPMPTVLDLTVTDGMLRETRIGLSAAWAVSQDSRIVEIAAAVDRMRSGMNSGFATSMLPVDYETALNDVILLVANGDMSQVELVNNVVRSGGTPVLPNNNAPTIAGTPTPTVAAGDSYSFRPTASDPDGDTLTFAVENQPAWASFDPSTGRLFGTPGMNDVGSYLDIVIVATDGDLDANLGPFTINVIADNQPPTISGSGATSLNIGEPYEFTPTASDPDGDPLTFSISNQPSWASFDPTTGILSGTPGAGDDGSYGNIIIRASDGELTTSLAPFTVIVVAENTAPTIGGIPDPEVSAGSRYSFTPTAGDADGNPLTFSVENPPTWATFDPATGRLSGNPDLGDVGSYLDIVISVSDGELMASLGPFTVNVIADNRPPTISGSGAATLDIGDPYEFTPTASDPDGDPLTFSISNRPSWASFDASTGILSGTPGAGDDGSYGNIIIRASDGELTTSLAPFTVIVVAANTAPTIGGIPDPEVSAGSRYSFTPTAGDADGNPLTFSVENPPTWATFDPATGRLSGNPVLGDVGSYLDIVISVSDGELMASLGPFTVNVIADNRPPTISGSGAATLDIGDPYEFTPTASDPDGDPLTFSIVNRPSWATFDPATGRLSGNPVLGDVGSYLDIVISVSDGELMASLGPFTVNVIADNRPPTISGSGAATLDIGDPYEFTPTASDPDGDPLTFSIVNRPSWASFNSSTGNLSGTPSAGEARTYSNIVMRASDGDLTTSLAAFAITVVAPNTAPTIGGSPDPQATTGLPYSFTPTASDAENDVLSFSISGKPVWAVFDASTGRLSGTPGAGHVGTYGNIRITVSDGATSAVLGPFSIAVISGNRAPTIAVRLQLQLMRTPPTRSSPIPPTRTGTT